MPPRRKPTSTSSFGVSRRENHDSRDFYARFAVPEVSSDSAIAAPHETDVIYLGDARDMSRVATSSVALVVTSPPYFAGKSYEQELGEGHIPGSYLEYLEMLEDVFAECARVLEPGGRMAINVANLGRKPFRSLAADVIGILQDRLQLLLRGEIIWQKAHGAGGSCAWGSFQSPANPVLRDVTERIVVASKGRFDRAQSRRQRAKKELPSEASMFKEDFMEATLDLWDIPPESATRVGHPAPFPVELPRRLIELYTYRDDLVLDPFMGSGSTAVASVQTDRHYVGFDTDPEYVSRATARVADERARLEELKERRETQRVVLPATPRPAAEEEPFQRRAVREGQRAKEIAKAVLRDCGFDVVEEQRRFDGGVEVNFVAKDARGRKWFLDVSGAFTTPRGGLRRTDTLWKALGKAAVLKAAPKVRNYRLLLLTTDLPPKGSAGDQALRAARGGVYHDAIAMLSVEGQDRLRAYASGEGWDQPIDDLLSPTDADDF